MLDKDLRELIGRYGLDEVLAALCRHIHGMEQTRVTKQLFRYLNNTYEWFKKKIPPADDAA